jgi:hypothetical protein
MLILAIGIVGFVIIAFGGDNSEKAINKVEKLSNLAPGQKVTIPENSNWSNELSALDFEGNKEEFQIDPNNLTDNLSVSFIANYMNSNQTGQLDPITKDDLINTAVEYASNSSEYNPSLPTFKIVPDDGKWSIAVYGEWIGLILRAYKPVEAKNELEILNQFGVNQDPSRLGELKIVAESYESIALAFKNMPVPKTFEQSHTNMIIGMEAIAISLGDLALTVEDPVRALFALKKYTEGSQLFANSLQATIDYIKSAKIIYRQGDGGYYLLNGI